MSARQRAFQRSSLPRSIALTSAIILSAGVFPAAPASAQSLPHFDSLGTHGSPGLDISSLPLIGDLLSGDHGNNSERELTVTPAAELSDGATVTISGKGYPAGASIYLAQTIEKPQSGYPSVYGEAAKVTVADDGTFTQEMPVATNFGDVDCTATQCYVASFTAFPNLNDRSNDQWVPITFEGGATDGSAGTGSTGSSSAGSDSASGSGSTSQPSGSQSSSGASVSLSKTTGLNPSGDTIHVEGKGFKSSGQGIYVGIAQNDQMDVTNADTFGPDTQYVSASRGNLNSDGSFSIDLPVSATFGSANCMTNACSVYTIAAHGSSDRSQDTATAVSFAGGVAKQEAALPSGGRSTGSTGSSTHGVIIDSSSRGPASASTSSSKPTVALSTTTLAPTGTTSITVTGSGFKTTGNGIYITVGEKSKYSTTNAEAFAAAVYVRTSEMTANGGFTKTIEVQPITEAANCLDNACALYTMAAHGSTDRSQDTATDLTVGGTEQEREQARKAGPAKASSQASGKATASGKASGAGDNHATDTETVQASANSPLQVVATAGLGAVIGALVFSAGLLVGRRKSSNDTAE